MIHKPTRRDFLHYGGRAAKVAALGMVAAPRLFGAISFVNSVSVAGDSDGVTTGAIDTSGANLIVAAINYFADPGVTDSEGNTYTALTGSAHSQGFTARLYYVLSPTTSATHTFTTSGDFSPIAVMAFSGVDSFDQQSGAATNNSTTFQPGSLTPPADNCLLVAAAGGQGDIGAASVNESFTIEEQVAFSGGVTYGITLAYKIQTSAGAQNPTFTVGSSTNASAVMATFEAAAEAPSTRRRTYILGNLIRRDLVSL